MNRRMVFFEDLIQSSCRSAPTRCRRYPGDGLWLGDNGYVVSSNLQTTWADPRALQPLGRTTRRHPNNQIRKLKSSLTQFGFHLPILIDGQSRVVAGFGLVLAALQLNLRRVPVIKITDLKEPE